MYPESEKRSVRAAPLASANSEPRPLMYLELEKRSVRAGHAAEPANPRVHSSVLPTPPSTPGWKPELTFACNKYRNNYEIGSVFPSPSVRLERMPLPRAPANHFPPGFSIAAIGYGFGVHQLLFP